MVRSYAPPFITPESTAPKASYGRISAAFEPQRKLAIWAEVTFHKSLKRGRQHVTGKIDAATPINADDFRAASPRFTQQARTANQALVDLLMRIAGTKGATPAKIALAWLLARAPFIVPIFGTRRLDRVEENLGASDVILSPADMREIETAVAAIDIQGERLPAAILQLSYR